MDQLSEKIIEELKSLEPLSIVITGSFAKGEEASISDKEIAVIFEKNKYKGRSMLRKFWTDETRVFPFVFEDIQNLTSDVPFPQKFYFWWSKSHSQTLWGEKVFENLNIEMKKEDWREVIFFEKGVGLSAMLSLRNKDQKIANWSFSKSCLFGSVAGLALSGKEADSYRDVVSFGSKNFPDFAELIQKAEKVRQGKENVIEEDIFQNFKYLNYLLSF